MIENRQKTPHFEVKCSNRYLIEGQNHIEETLKQNLLYHWSLRTWKFLIPLLLMLLAHSLEKLYFFCESKTPKSQLFRKGSVQAKWGFQAKWPNFFLSKNVNISFHKAHTVIVDLVVCHWFTSRASETSLAALRRCLHLRVTRLSHLRNLNNCLIT